MNKGSLIIILAMVLVVVVLSLIMLGYQPPEKEPAVSASANIQITGDCESNITCFEEAIKNDCEAVYFEVDDLISGTRLSGQIRGEKFGDCEVHLKDPSTNLSMICYLDEAGLASINSLDRLSQSCSGDLIDSLLKYQTENAPSKFGAEVDKINSAIDLANYCSVKADCAEVGSKCPFGCHIFVNYEKVDEINALIAGYDNPCMYKCKSLKGYDCVGGKCVALYD